MNVALPPEFEAFARDQVAAGTAASVEEAAAVALRSYLAQVDQLRAAVDEGLADLERGDVVEAEPFMRELIDETRARFGG